MSAICTDDIRCCDDLPIFKYNISELIIFLISLQGDDSARSVNDYAMVFHFLTKNELGKVLRDDKGIWMTSVLVKRREVSRGEPCRTVADTDRPDFGSLRNDLFSAPYGVQRLIETDECL